MTNSDLKQRLTETICLLQVPGVGKGRYWQLVKKFGSPSAVLSAPVSKLEEIPRLPRKVASAIKHQADLDSARKAAEGIIELGWGAVFAGDADYPPGLLQIPDSPPLLFRAGDKYSPDDRMIAIVGTRHATERGKRFARKLAADLAAAGVIVVSGMAEGIDSAAHAGAIEAGGRTVAIWGTSLDIVYPPVNKALAEQIKKHGAVYSEYPPNTRPDRAYFPERNRIISGMSEGVVVIEAGVKSGALITADLALEQGRELFAVPGSPDARNSIGTNKLIKRGARLVTSIDDIFEELPRLKGQVAAGRFRRQGDMTELEQKMVGLLSDGPLQIDSLARVAGMPVNDLMELLLALELKGVVQELSGKRFVLAQ